MKTLSTILNKEFDFKAVHIGLFLNDDLWMHDKWKVVINGQDFDYNTGIGHRVEDIPFNKAEFKRVMSINLKKEKENLLLYIDNLKSVSKVKPLNIDDVLYSLILDCEAGQMLFSDFCDNFGYDEDSIAHNEIHKQCQANTKKVRMFIPNIEEAAELFQDY
jgi:hypothetical protein